MKGEERKCKKAENNFTNIYPYLIMLLVTYNWRKIIYLLTMIEEYVFVEN